VRSTHPHLAPACLSHACPALLQVKEEGWWLVAGDSRTGELYALKRVSFGQRTTAR
jgi:hypothetical protein